MKFDEVLSYIGEFGFYQIRTYAILCIPSFTAAFHALVTVFIVALPDHRCAIPGLDNDTYDFNKSGVHGAWLVEQFIPLDGKSYNSCYIYNASLDGNWSNTEHLVAEKCHKWVFSKEVFETTVTEKMGLVCDDLIKRSHLNSLFQGGIMVGSLLFGNLADIFGRKKILYFSLMGSLVVGVATVWVPEYISMCFSRFLLGMLGSGYFLNAFTIGIELVGPSKRMWTGMIIEVYWAIGSIVMAGVAYGIRDWQYLQLAISVPSVLYVLYWWLIPESPRWLLANGRKKEAEKILRHAAKVNKTTLPDNIFEDKIDVNDKDPGLPTVKIWHYFSQPTLLIRSLIIFLNWCVVSMVYYGLSLNSGYLYGGVHLNFLLSTLVELVAYILCFPLLDRLGRKKLHAASMIIGGVACCCTIFSVLYLAKDYQWVTTALSLIGKLGASAAFAVIYIFSSELFPTVVRNGGMGFSSMSARVGSMASPYIADLGKLVGGTFGVALPLIVFGGASVAAGVASLWLPETLNRKLPETIEDAINFGKKSPDEIKMGKLSVVAIGARKLSVDNPALELDKTS